VERRRVSGNRTVEYAGLASMNAYRSLSKHTGVPLDRVLAHARNNTLAVVLECRGASRGTDPDVMYQHLYRRKLLSLLEERWALITGGS
jgi:hypothetical protein